MYAPHVSSVLSPRTFAYSNVSSPRHGPAVPVPGAVVLMGSLSVEDGFGGVSLSCGCVSAVRAGAWFACIWASWSSLSAGLLFCIHATLRDSPSPSRDGAICLNLAPWQSGWRQS